MIFQNLGFPPKTPVFLMNPKFSSGLEGQGMYYKIHMLSMLCTSLQIGETTHIFPKIQTGMQSPVASMRAVAAGQ